MITDGNDNSKHCESRLMSIVTIRWNSKSRPQYYGYEKENNRI